MIDEARKIIESISADCLETGSVLSEAMGRLLGVQAEPVLTEKIGAFDAAGEAIKQAYADCPKHADDLKRLSELLGQAATIKCGGS